MNNIEELLTEANSIMDILCDGFLDMPSGCEGCPLYNDEIDETNGCDKVKWNIKYRERN